MGVESVPLNASVIDLEAGEKQILVDEASDNSSTSTACIPTTTSPGEKEISVDEAGAGFNTSTAFLPIPPSPDEKGIIWVDWNGANDPENPYNFTDRKKWTTILIVCLYTALVAFIGSAFAVGQGSLGRDLNTTSELSILALSIFPLGFGLAPLVLSPFSEAFGRYTMYLSSCIVLVIALFPTAFAQNITTVIIFRFIGGLGASTGSTLVGGSVADLFSASTRGKPMSVFSICAFSGTGLGPALMGYVEERLPHGWRWIEYIQIVMSIVTLALLIFCTEETRGSVILSRRAKKLRQDTGDDRYQCKSDSERSSLIILIKVSMTRPLYLLATEPIVAAFSMWIALGWGLLYLTLEAVPLVFQEVYGFTIGEVGSVFWASVVAAFIGFGLNFYQEKLYIRNYPIRGPEARLYLSRVAGLTLPLGMFIFAFAQGRTHWIVPVIGLTIVFESIFCIYLAVFTYLADTYTVYASSALSGQSLCRNLFGFAFPLFTSQMYLKLGFQWASFLGGVLALVLGITPFVLMRYGPQIRAASKFSKSLAHI